MHDEITTVHYILVKKIRMKPNAYQSVNTFCSGTSVEYLLEDADADGM